MVSEPVSEKFGAGKSLGTGIGKIWYWKKVSEPVSEKFGTEKSTGIGIENIWYRKKVSVSVSFNILGTVTHWYKGSFNVAWNNFNVTMDLTNFSS